MMLKAPFDLDTVQPEIRTIQDAFIQHAERLGLTDETVICYESPITLGDLRRNLYPRLKWAMTYALRQQGGAA